ncbi:hypothetical protein A4H97_29510 [Niastella yeongjuensis]|uniref:OmpA-like domain-containing protein n=1 Tax=Niastella yeongjuensis TaxID=354355 RepID=A0A1V9ESK3_9BACT|nr:OmpA family protein [Niastella yeongjuensis]OQP49022.1 hypothetical protein A4H97_29510 [Niastella yeongjuensis]SEP10601.1 Outer membrane protein OmpA [Niastella yeongjuensis]
MKKSFSCFTGWVLISAIAMGQSQNTAINPVPVKEHYTVSGGLLGAYNYSQLRVSDNDNVKYDWRSGWAAGLWVNFSVSNNFSIEPQVAYKSLEYKSDETAFFNNGTVDYISVPVLFKFHFGRNLALLLGPEFDFATKVEDDNNTYDKEDITNTSINGTAGLELFPHGRFSVYVRYFHGFTDMNDADNSNTVGEFYNQGVQAGLKFKLFGKHILADTDGDGIKDKDDKCPGVVGLTRYNGCPIPDTDGDGVNDEQDKCPNQTGLAKYQGCPIPDTDGDGINDEQDKCPNQAGVADYQGCPIPDTDGDGVKDDVDKCPNQAGLEKYQGCPIPDSDGDGINDEEDRCPNEPGVPEMKGCKAIEKFEANRVTFATGKSVLTPQGKKELDIVIAFIQRAPEGLKISLVGHTDSTGSDKINVPLSQARADAAKAYLVSKGIDQSRIATEGHGSSEPVASNKTKAGKTLNRRVEVTIQ